MENNKLRVIFVGIPDMALVCLTNLQKAGFNIVGVVPPKKNHETFSFFKDFVLKRGLNFLEFNESPNEPTYIEKLKALNADIGVVCSYNSLLKEEFLKTTRLGYINSHPSDLPRYRGACPYFHIVANGEKTSAITLHMMDKTFDTGDIVCQKKFELLPFETMGTIFNRTTYLISDALIEILTSLEKTGELKRYPQPKGDFITAPKVGNEFRLRWNSDCLALERLIRACNPFFTAFSVFRGAVLKILKAKAIVKKHSYMFGKIVKANKNEILVAAKNGFLSIEFLSVGTWGYFDVREFYATFTPNTDEFLL